MGASELGIIALIVLLIFGGSQLPKLARNLGQAQKEFKDGLAQGEAEAAKRSATETTAAEPTVVVEPRVVEPRPETPPSNPT